MGETNPDQENVLDEDVWKSDDEDDKDNEEEEDDKEEEKLEKDAPLQSEDPSQELAAKQSEKEQKPVKTQFYDFSHKNLEKRRKRQ
jgi:hypothetical protein